MFKLATKIGLLVILLVAFAGCEGIQNRQDLNGDGVVTRAEAEEYYAERLSRGREIADQYQSISDDLEAQAAQLSEQLATMSEDDPLIQRIQDIIDTTIEKKAEADEIVANVRRQLAEAEERIADLPETATAADVNSTAIGQAVTTVGSFLPPPWNAIATGLGGLFPFVLAKFFRVKQERDAVINSIDAAASASPEFRDQLDKNGGIIRSTQGTIAPRIDKLRKTVSR